MRGHPSPKGPNRPPPATATEASPVAPAKGKKKLIIIIAAAVAAVVLIVIGLTLFLRHSRWGKAMRAMSDNPDLARLSGVDNRKVTMLTWAIVGALCAASGFMLGINNELHSMMVWQVLLPMFAPAILRGCRRVVGCV